MDDTYFGLAVVRVPVLVHPVNLRPLPHVVLAERGRGCVSRDRLLERGHVQPRGCLQLVVERPPELRKCHSGCVGVCEEEAL